MFTADNLQEHRAALTGHCYRMLGSAVEADDASQETLIRAWKSLDRFDGRASLKTWLYRIATNVCLDALADRSHRGRPMEEGPAGSLGSELVEKPRSHWLEPVPDARAIPAEGDPAEIAMARQSIRLAFVAALQHLPPKQRAALLMTEVLGWSAQETAESLSTTVASINSALQRARDTLATRDLGDGAPLSQEQTKLVEQYVAAFERYDLDRLSNLLREDAVLSMPPFTLWLQGPASIHTWMAGPGEPCRGSKLIATSANGHPAFGQYRRAEGGGYRPWALIVLELAGARILRINSFLDTATLFPLFGLPATPPQ
jgi:RNA polymerase sigma-70 factor (ECF subfamily)